MRIVLRDDRGFPWLRRDDGEGDWKVVKRIQVVRLFEDVGLLQNRRFPRIRNDRQGWEGKEYAGFQRFDGG